ncbi:hypothetical protein AURDEDRAFT_175462 [Auricularia subglabra TFB-10046 SS5]|uniref:DUF6533 domain-containing protein n=1 Tax=Auricularia subglabra (strain TFB-10046 / SS5) TaxID=717982 RepID=J0D8A3_AURST|nr:hypothetical protein AURDEDRAFT_175462 [Auricularia subglabra TFB-10046 SS5]
MNASTGMGAGMGMGMGADFPGILIDAAHFAQVTRYMHIAAYLVVVYDWLICLEHEVDFVFRDRLSRAKVAYVFCRYWPLLTYPIIIWIQGYDHDRAICAKVFRIPMIIAIPNFASAASILILRIFAFTGGSHYVTTFLTLCFVGVVAYQTWVGAVEAILIPFGNGCYPVNPAEAKYLSGYFLSSLLWDCIATFIFGIYALKMRLKWSEATAMTRIFISEGALYFVAISAVNLINGAFNLQPRVLMSGTMIPMGMLLPNILACRLVINLRRKVGPRTTRSVENASTRMGFQHNRAPSRQIAADDYSLTTIVIGDDAGRLGVAPGYHSARGSKI